MASLPSLYRRPVIMPSNRKVGGQYQSRRADSPMDDQYSKLEDQLDEMWRARDLPELILVAGDTSGREYSAS